MFMEMPDGDIINLANVIAVQASDYLYSITIYTDYGDTFRVEASDAANQEELMGRLDFLLHGAPFKTGVVYIENLILRTDKIRHINIDEDNAGKKLMKIYIDKYQFLIDNDAEKHMQELTQLLSRKNISGGNTVFVKL